MHAMAPILGLLASLLHISESISLSRVERAHKVAESRAVEQFGSTVHEVSKDEIMATMTVEKAYRAFMAMNHSKLDKDIVEMIQQKIGGKQTQNGAVERYNAVDSARDMLNSMMNEAVMNKELEGIRCSEYETKQLKMISSLEQDITYANAEASACKAEVLRTTEVIQVLSEVQLPKYRGELKVHITRCQVDIAAVKAQLSIVMADKAVMKRILDMVCADDVRTTMAPIFLAEGVQETEALDERMQQGQIVQCTSCMTGQKMAWFKHNSVQPLLATVKSTVAKEYIQDNLLEEFDDEERRHPTKVATVLLQRQEIEREYRSGSIPGIEMPGMNLTFPPPDGVCNEAILADNSSTYRGCQAETISGKTCQKWTVQSPQTHTKTVANYPLADLGEHNYCRNPDGEDSIWCFTTDPGRRWEFCEPLVDLKVPNGIAKHQCVETDACKLSGPNCTKLKDRFLLIMAGIQDKKMELSEQLDNLEDSCQKTQERFETSISNMEAQLKEEQTNFAAATKCLQDGVKASSDANMQHGELGKDYHATMETCCSNKNGFTAEICALSKIRGELYKIEGAHLYIIDCEVSGWTDKECSVSCSGEGLVGKQDRDRQVLIHPINGTECPPLTMERSCNLEGCPVDCTVGDWAEWSDCTAECGGGVKSRSREKVQEPENGGDPCPEQTETVECEGQSCNADCVLNDWDAWSLCSKACDEGHQQRRKKVIEEERGLGVCAGDDDETRLNFQTCNDFDCRELIPASRDTLKCSAMLDLIILLDGSGSLGWYGWVQSKKMSKKLIGAMIGGEQNVQVALLLFSGPKNWRALDDCTGENAEGPIPSPTSCGIYWIDHFTTDIPGLVQKAGRMRWPGRTTLTSYALSEGKAEILQGRPDAQTVVVVITDGKPMSPIKTGSASRDLKEQARLIYIPVGRGVKKTIPLMKQWASRPPQDNVLTLDTFATLATPSVLNKMISTFCNIVQ